MEDNVIRQCGSGWAYCNGDCKSCREPRVIASNHTTTSDDFCMANGINGYVYFVDDVDKLKEHIANAKIVADAVERTNKYKRRYV